MLVALVYKFFLILILITILGLFEKAYPAEKNHSLIGKARNIFYISFFLFFGALITSQIVSLLASYVSIHALFTFTHTFLTIIVYLFLIDFLFYWYHRAEHTFKMFWAIHELHHSDQEMNVTTSLRTYFLEYPLQFLLLSLPLMYIIPIDSETSFILLFVTTFWLFFTHTNIRLHLGFLSKYLCGPQVHRIHHSNLPIHADKNFAQFFPFIDVIFGTYYSPHKDEFPTTGTANLSGNTPITTALLRPWKKWFN